MWVLSGKYINSNLNVKARLVARGFQENNQNVFCDSPKESIRLVLSTIALPLKLDNHLPKKFRFIRVNGSL